MIEIRTLLLFFINKYRMEHEFSITGPFLSTGTILFMHTKFKQIPEATFQVMKMLRNSTYVFPLYEGQKFGLSSKTVF